MKQLIRWIGRVVAVILALLGIALVLLMTPIGARGASAWVTGLVAQQAPGTEVAIGWLMPRWPLGVEARAVRWNKTGAGAAAAPILTSDRVLARLDLGELLYRTLDWSVEGQVDRLDLAALGQAFGQGGLGAQGIMTGPVKLAGVDSELEQVELKLEAQAPGGSIKSSFFKSLSWLSQGDAGKLAQALEGQKLIHFTTGKLEVATERNQYRVKVYFDGDHLLDFTIYLPRNGLKLLFGLLKGGHSG